MDCGVFVGCCNLGGNDVDPYGLLAFTSVLRAEFTWRFMGSYNWGYK